MQSQEQPTIFNPETNMNLHNRLAVVTGLPGCGKDFLLDKVFQERPLFESNIQMFHFGEILFEKLKTLKTELQFQSADRDDIRDTLTQDQISGAILNVAGKIVAEQPGVINTHLIYRQKSSLVINPDIISVLNPKLIIFIKANSRDIYEWRTVSERNRDLESKEYIDFYQDIARGVAINFARFFKSEFVEINNTSDPDDIKKNVAILNGAITKI